MQVKNSLIHIFSLLISLSINFSIAQDMEFPEDKVHYTIKTEQKDCEVTIFADIEIEDKWHINAANLPTESFSIPTDIYIDTSSRYIIEDTIYEPEFHHIYDEIAKENLYLHDGKITISRKIFVQTQDDFTLKGYFTFQTCDDNHCLPPYDGEFEFKVNGCDFQDYSPPLTSKENQPETKAGSEKKVNFKKNISWEDNKMNVLIPMAGAGKRFADAGYIFPKPLIEINNKPMIQWVIESLNLKANYIFIIQKEHQEKYNVKSVLNVLQPNCKIIELDHITEGAACTTLLAKKYINNSDPLIIANSDQYIRWNSSKAIYDFNSKNLDGAILTFEAIHPKWSYAKCDDQGFVTEVAEKKVISKNATVGVYYWKHGSDYVNSAEKMIEKNIRVNNEFYVCPVYNEFLLKKKKVKIYNVDEMQGLGTPEDLNNFLRKLK